MSSTTERVTIQIGSETGVGKVLHSQKRFDSSTEFITGLAAKKRQEKKELAELCETIRQMAIYDDDALEDNLLTRVLICPSYFYKIASDHNVRGDIRAQSTRLIVRQSAFLDPETVNNWIQLLSTDKDMLVRLGVLYGYDENDDHDGIRRFFDDPNPRVQQIAQSLL